MAEFGRIWQTAKIAPVLTQFFVGGRRFAGGHRVGFRPDLRSLGLKSLINARISPGSRPMSLHPPTIDIFEMDYDLFVPCER